MFWLLAVCHALFFHCTASWFICLFKIECVFRAHERFYMCDPFCLFSVIRRTSCWRSIVVSLSLAAYIDFICSTSLLFHFGWLFLLWVADFDATFTVTDEVIAAIDPRKVEILQRYYLVCIVIIYMLMAHFLLFLGFFCHLVLVWEG